MINHRRCFISLLNRNPHGEEGSPDKDQGDDEEYEADHPGALSHPRSDGHFHCQNPEQGGEFDDRVQRHR